MPIKGSVTVKPQAFAAAVKWVAKFVNPRPSVPIQGGIAITVTGGAITMSAFNEYANAAVHVPCSGDGAGRAIVSGRLLAELVATLGTKDVTIQPDPDRGEGGIQLVTGRFRGTLPTMAEDDLPSLPGPVSPSIGEVGGDALHAAVARVAPVAWKDVTASNTLVGVHLRFTPDALCLIASDTRRVASAEVAYTGGAGTALVLAPTLLDAAAAFVGPDQVAIGLDDNNISLTTATRSITVRLSAGTYPEADFRRFLAFDPDQVALIQIAELAEPLKRAETIRAKTGPIQLFLTPGEMAITASAADLPQDSDDAIDVDYQGPDHGLAFTPEYLADILQSAPGAVLRMTFRATAPGEKLTPAVFTDPDDDRWVHVLMPLRMP